MTQAIERETEMGKELILPGQNNAHAEFTRQSVKPREDVNAERANFYLKTCGESMTPPGCEYVGSFASHIYKNRLNPMEFTTIQQAPIGNAHEVWTDIAWKEIRKVLMAKFGRKEPAKRA
jgi:hypothetical protein